MSTTITIRVPKNLKDDLARYEIEISKVARRALEEEVKKREREELQEIAKELGEFFKKIPRERIVKGIREDRGPLR